MTGVFTRPQVRRAVGAGLIAGVVLVYLGAIGMIEAFNVRNLINDIVTLGKVLMSLPPFLAGYLVARPRVVGGEVRRLPPVPSLALSGLAGALAGGVLISGVALVHAFPAGAVRHIFFQVSPTLLSIVTFGRGLPVAAVILIVGGGLLGAAGAGFQLLPADARRVLAIGLFTTFAFALLQRLIPPALFQLGMDTTWLYSTTFLGLTIVGALVIFGVSAALALAWRRGRDRVQERARAVSKQGRLSARAALYLLILAGLAVVPQLVGTSLSQTLGSVGIYVLMGLGLNIVVGYAGLLDLGYVAFFAVGAYSTAIFTGAHRITSLGGTVNPAFHLDLNFYEALPVVILFAAFIGLLIGAPVLRLRGDYLAIVTLGFGEIARVLITSDWWSHLVGGAQGLRDVTDAHIGSMSFQNPKPFYYLALAVCLLAIYVSWRLSNSRIGRAWNAMREDEQVAEAMGISTVKYKLLAFAMGAGVGCLSGALFAVQIGSLNPASFTILVSITALAVIILGGMGRIAGVIVGALVLIGIPSLLDEFEQYQLLLYGAVLVAIMVLRPQGLIPNVRRARELHEEERDQDAWLKRAGDASVEPAVAVGTARESE